MMRFLWIGAIVGPLPITLVNGTIADATQVMTDLNFIASQVNSNATQGAGSITRNVLINGAMQFAQRLGGTSTTLTLIGQKGYGCDRWQGSTGAAQTGVVSQITSIGLNQFQYACRVQRQSGQTATTTIALAQSLETIDSYPMQGQTVTLSFYARVGSNYSPSSNALVANVITGTGTDQNVLTGYTGAATSITNTFNLTNNWLRYSVSGTIPTTATEIGVTFVESPTGTAGTNDYFDITGVQLELSASASNFEFLPAEVVLAKCQRYYQKSFVQNQAPATGIATGQIISVATFPGGDAIFFPSLSLPVLLRSLGATCTVYNPFSANNQVRDFNFNADYTSTLIGTTGMTVAVTGVAPVGAPAGDEVAYQFTADAEL